MVEPREDERARQLVLTDRQRERLLQFEVNVDEREPLGRGIFVRRRMHRGDLALQRVHFDMVPRALATLDLLSDRKAGLDATVVLRRIECQSTVFEGFPSIDGGIRSRVRVVVSRVHTSDNTIESDNWTETIPFSRVWGAVGM